MLRAILGACLLLLALTANADAFWQTRDSTYGNDCVITNCTGGGGGPTAFTALHTYYMSPTGNDSNNGTSAGTPWLTPNHSVVCGDVIIAAAGNYTNSGNNMRVTGTVSNCPSTVDGIDGTGGIYAAIILCGGSDVNSCIINCDAGSPCNASPQGGPPVAVSLAANNWAIEGFTVNGASDGNNLAFQAEGCVTAVTNHLYFINDVAYNTGQAFTPQDCGSAYGADYVRIVGMIAENAVLFTGGGSGICIGAIDVVSPGTFGSSTTDVKYFIYNNYTWNNINTACDTPTTQADGEDFLFDTLTNHTVKGHYVLTNNIGFYAERECINNFAGAVGSSVIFRQYNNTCFDNGQRGDETGETFGTEINIANYSGTYDIFNNIGYFPSTTNQAGNPVLALNNGGTNPTTNIGAQYAAGDNNIFLSAATSCPGATCNSGPPYSVTEFNGASFGTNTYTNPSFKNTTDLINNHLATPNCTGFVNTTLCLGWNANTNSSTALSFIDDLIPTAGGMTNKGFQLPSTTCVSSGELFNDYPADLKGIVYLHWTGSAIVQNHDLVTTPCGY